MKKRIKKAIPKKRGTEFVKLNKLSKADLTKINMKDLWIIKPVKGKPSVRARLCGCRDVCLA